MSYSKAHKSQSKERILASATELFSRYGFEKVSIGKIMKLARMTHGAFYAHFESKEALFNASILETFKRSRVARLAKGPFAVRHLTSLITDYLNLLAVKEQSTPGPETLLFNEIGSERVEIRKLYEQAYQHMKSVLEKRITALARLNKLRFAADRNIISEKSRAIIASMIGAVSIARSITDEQEQQQILLAGQNQILAILGVETADADWVIGS
ncbi:TetR/AcrR family transcriptional regulator [Nitrincola tibetensis]|uniref:TetR/AcrR family transcriptional regulator n=1 Tax=Nitrincola tibetensis TaxID=2219697 RepID=A0A364NJ21_9GAMM|nr:TetR/AcrR family transcriptional regulator [Nitrincola tibetensis]RAU17031.1 TetR/AcrR family transcriptional regulator [Nitrincola tibetensis]